MPIPLELEKVVEAAENDGVQAKLSPSERTWVDRFVSKYREKGYLSDREFEIIKDIVERYEGESVKPKSTFSSRRYEGFKESKS